MELVVGSGVEIVPEGLSVPPSVYEHYSGLGIHEIFQWQSDCLRLPGVLDAGRNLVYSAPTSAGKTLVSEIIVVKHVMESSSKAMIILPFVSVSREKMVYLQRLFSGLGVRVGGFMAGQSPVGGFSAVNVAVCTIEKANSLVNRLIEEGRLDELGVIVVDELHLIGDSHRGYLLELLLTKVLVHTRRVRLAMGTRSQFSKTLNISELSDNATNSNRLFKGIQVIGMSATLPNLSALGDWLDAFVYFTDFRPVPLMELVFSRDPRTSACHCFEIVQAPPRTSHTLRSSPGHTTEQLRSAASPILDVQLISEAQLNTVDEDGVFLLCLDTLLSGHGVLVFCPTKQWCEQLSDTMARHVFRLTQTHFVLQNQDVLPGGSTLASMQPTFVESIGSRLASRLNRTGLLQCVEQLRRCPAGLDPALARCLGYAVAFHHAGLTIEERDIIENGFRTGIIRILVATSTLSSGVNLPARRVIIRTPLFHGRILDYLCYKQMAGRAGRKGIDTAGQSILLCKPRDLPRVRQLISSGMPPVHSCLTDSHGVSPESSLKRALLEVISNGFVETVAEAHHYICSTFMASELHLEPHNNQSVFCTPHSGPHRRSSRLSQNSALSNGPLSPNFLASPKDRTNRLLQLCLSNLCDQELIALGKFPCEDQGCSACCPSSHDRSSSQVHSKLFSSCTRLRPTPLGRAILASSLGPTHGLVVLQELDKARRSIALDTDLHLVYLLTPIYLDVGANLDWFRYLEQYQRLSASDRRVADLVGIEERFITRCAAGASLTDGRHNRAAANAERLALHRRFYTALTLYRLVCEDGLSKVAEDFGVNRGLLQSLQQQASTYAGMVTIFCNRLGWVHLERLLASFQSRLFYGIAEELVDLIRLSPLINVQRARALRSGGINSISSLANSRVSDVTRLLQTAVQFQRSESSAEATFRHRTIQLDDGSYVNEEEAAELAVQKAQELLREDLAAVYGANIVLPFNKVQKSNSQVEELCGSTPVKHSNRASPNDSSSSSERSQNAFQSKSVSPPPTNTLPNTPLKRALSDVITTPLSTKRIKLSSSPNDCPLITIAPSSVSFTDSERFADLHHDEGTSLPNAYTAESLYLHTVESRSSLESISFSSQSQETFVLTTQLTAIIDNACVPAHTDSSNHSVCEPNLQSTGDCVYSTLEPSFPFEYGMNDTLTCSMLDTAIAPAAFITPQTTSMTQAVVSGVTSMQNAGSQSFGDLFDTSPMHTSVPIASHTEHISITGVIPESQISPPTLCHSEACSDLPLTADGLIFTIVDVAKTTDIWSTFISDLTNWVKRLNRCTDNLSSIAIQPCWTVAEVTKPPPSSITWFSGPAGYGAVGGGVETRSDKHPIMLCLAGLAICSSLLSPDTVFWVDLAAEKGLASEYPSLSKRLEEISAVLELITRTPLALVVWDAKWWSRLVYDVFGVKSRVSLFDPGTCGWIRDPDRGRAPLAGEVLRLSPKLSRLIDQLKRSNLSPEPPTQFSDWSQLLPCSPLASSDWCPPVRNALYHRLSLLPEHVNQASAQCFLLSQWTDPDLFCLNEVPRVLLELEIPCHCVLSRLESTGFTLDLNLLSQCRDDIVRNRNLLEGVAHRLAGRPFQLDSPKEISQVLFLWLHLPQLTDPKATGSKKTQLSLLHGRRAQSRGPALPRATNDLLSRLRGLHPLPSIILEWRHLHGLLEKTFGSLVAFCECPNHLSVTTSPENKVRQISPIYDVHTATGRIVSCVPNIQAVPHDILIDYPGILTRRTPTMSQACPAASTAFNASDDPPCSQPWSPSVASLLTDLPTQLVIIRPRQAFCSISGGMLISADFCQLELRLLAHFSRDANILSLLSVPPASDGVDTSSVMPPPPNHDAFRKLAAHWLKLPSPDSVTSIQRQQAKQLCYALVYGMSARGLAAQLDIPEAKAQRLIDSFLRSFPGLQCFIAETIQSARRLGHVTTLKGRVRLLPALVDTATSSVDASGTPFKTPLIQGRSAQMRQHCSAAKAERQAVNTVIQGSAAEISKMAMLAVDSVLSTSGRSDLCRLVLHEHDELIYQISHAAAGPELGSLIRHTMAKMSKSCGLSVSLPVKLRAGPNWCDLEEVFWH